MEDARLQHNPSHSLQPGLPLKPTRTAVRPVKQVANGRKQVVRGSRVERSDWEVLSCDHHEGHIGWDAFERNQRLINDNANSKSWARRGAVRRQRLAKRGCSVAATADASCTSPQRDQG